jgi:integrase
LAWVEKKKTAKGTRYIGRYRAPDGKKRKSPPMTTRSAAKTWAEDAESALRRGEWVDPNRGKISFREWVQEWWELYDFLPSTESVYYSMLHKHLLPKWGDVPIASIEPIQVDMWTQQLRAKGYSENHVQGVRRLLSVIMEDAVYYERIKANPARQMRRRHSGRRMERQRRDVATSPLGALLIAERAGLLGREDEFLAVITLAYTGLRWAEFIGMERRYCWLKEKALYVEQQIVEVGGRHHVQPPKTPESRREIKIPDFLVDLLGMWLRRDDRTHLYMTRSRTHPSGSRCSDAYWRPAADGWHPKRTNRHGTPIGDRPVLADMSAGFPGVPHIPSWPAAQPREEFVVPSRKGVRRFPADGVPASWLPIRSGLTPHDLRRSMRTWLEDAGVPMIASETRMGHVLPGIQPVYTVVTPRQQQLVMDALETAWWTSLAQRWQLSKTSPLPVLQPWLEMVGDRIASGEVSLSVPPICPPSGRRKVDRRAREGT